jgi:hypothetical protein
LVLCVGAGFDIVVSIVLNSNACLKLLHLKLFSFLKERSGHIKSPCSVCVLADLEPSDLFSRNLLETLFGLNFLQLIQSNRKAHELLRRERHLCVIGDPGMCSCD